MNPFRRTNPHLPNTGRSRRARGAGAAFAAIFTPLLGLTVLAVGGALAQSSAENAPPPPPPPGPGQITVQIIADAGSAATEGITIALYALAPDGSPGLTDGKTDAEGRITFTGISNDPGIVYLVGARYAEIPFGERVTFDPGATQTLVEIHVSSPTDQVSDVRIEEVRARIDWMGDRIVVTEILRLVSTGQRVILLSQEDHEEAILRRTLPAQARDFSAGRSSMGDGLALKEGRIRFWGPLYPGEQRIEYRYSLPVSADLPGASGERTLQLPIEFREATDRVIVVAGTTGIEAEGPGFVASDEIGSDSGQPLSSWARGALAGGQRIEVALTLPESRLDAAALSIPRAEVWLDLDDTRLTANVDLQLQVEPGAPVSGSSEAPLMHISITPGASLGPLAPAVESMGVTATGDGGFDVIGPIGPGEHSFAFSYRLPSRPEGIEIGLRFPREVATLNVLIADTGLALESRRLHRRRPFRNGTRNFLHREAFTVGSDEIVDLSLTPIRSGGLPQAASMALTVAGAAAAALFLIAPLRRVAQHEQRADPESIRIHDEREAIYTAIGDLDHDFETGKLDESDYAEMRSGLRGQAIELLRSERAGGEAAAGATRPDATGAAASPPATGAFCPSCGQNIDPRWHFCSHCGGELSPATSAGPSAEEKSG
ncbi:MAG: zinc ribbon domain-containing protein [bacterium]|nr:zinc ribbon domain-containing protein [bacterium]